MSSSAREPPTNLLDLSVDCLVHIAAYLDVHCVAYVLTLTSRQLHAIAHDPVLWARLLVEPCCDDELIWMAKKHPTIRSIFMDPSPQACNLVLETCSNLEYWPWLELLIPEHNLALTAARLTYEGQVPPVSAYGSLVSLNSSVPIPADTALLLSEHCPRVRSLEVPEFIQSSPTAFPQLRTLASARSRINSKAWAEFVKTHPHLVDLGLFRVTIDLKAKADTPAPVCLARFSFSSGVLGDGELMPFCYHVVNSSCATVVEISWDAQCDFALLLACTHLRRVSVHRVVNFEGFQEFAVNANLESLESKYRSTETEFLEAMCEAMGSVRQLSPFLLTSVTVSMLSHKLRHVKVLTLTEALPIESMAILGNQIVALRVLCFNRFPLSSAEAMECLAPALHSLEVLRVVTARLSYVPIVRAAAESTSLRELDVQMTLAATMKVLVEAFVESWCGGEPRGPLEWLRLYTVPHEMTDWLLDVVASGGLTALTHDIAFNSNRGPQDEVRALLDPCYGRRGPDYVPCIC